MVLREHFQNYLQMDSFSTSKPISAAPLLTHPHKDLRFFAKIALEKEGNQLFEDVHLLVYEDFDYYTKLHFYAFVFISKFTWADRPAFRYVVLISDNKHKTFTSTHLFLDSYENDRFISKDITGSDDAYRKIQEGIKNFKEYIVPLHNFEKAELNMEQNNET